jgi:hypothetical protein
MNPQEALDLLPIEREALEMMEALLDSLLEIFGY